VGSGLVGAQEGAEPTAPPSFLDARNFHQHLQGHYNAPPTGPSGSIPRLQQRPERIGLHVRIDVPRSPTR